MTTNRARNTRALLDVQQAAPEGTHRAIYYAALDQLAATTPHRQYCAALQAALTAAKYARQEPPTTGQETDHTQDRDERGPWGRGAK